MRSELDYGCHSIDDGPSNVERWMTWVAMIMVVLVCVGVGLAVAFNTYMAIRTTFE